jgi:hypothetical protein
MILLVGSILGLIISVSMTLGMHGILPFSDSDSNNQSSSVPSLSVESGGEPVSNSSTANPIPETEPIGPEVTVAQNQSSGDGEPQADFVRSSVNFSTFENSNSGISIRYSSNWQIQDEDNDRDGTMDIVGFLSPFEDRFDKYKERLWLSLDTLPSPNITLYEYSRGVIEHNSDTQQSFQLLDNDTDSIILGGYPAYRYVTTWTLDDGTILKQMEIGTKIRDKVYYIDYYAEQQKYASFLPVVQEMINSFKLR